jgi:hypothetical protein
MRRQGQWNHSSWYYYVSDGPDLSDSRAYSFIFCFGPYRMCGWLGLLTEIVVMAKKNYWPLVAKTFAVVQNEAWSIW